MDENTPTPLTEERLMRAENRLQRLKRLCNIAIATNQAILQARVPQEVFERACRIAVDNGYGSASIRLLDRDTLELVSAAGAGHDSEAAEKIRVSADASVPEGRGLYGLACRTGEAQIKNDYAAGLKPGSSYALKVAQYIPGSGAAFPLRRAGEVVGVFGLHDRQKNVFDDEIVSLLQQLADNISFALDNFRRDEERTRAEQALAAQRDLLRGLMDNVPDFIYFKDRELRYQCISAAVATQFGLKDPAEVIGRRSIDFLPESVAGKLESEDREMLDSGVAIVDREEHLVLPGRGSLWASKTAVPIRNGRGEITGVVAIVRDITARKEAEERANYLATHDGLTGLPNRRMFGEVLDLAVKTAGRYERKFAVMFIDLDRFKIINDTLGHEAGDVLLKEMASRLSECLRAGDVVARLGGDEFVVLVQEAGEQAAVSAVGRKLLSAAIKPVSIRGQECRVTASIGICTYPDGATDAETLMKNADAAMYMAKEEGKNNFQFYSSATRSHSLARMTLETNLRLALERDEFLLHYQSKVDMQGRVTGVEALLRWQQPDMGLLQPLQFIPLAEETGLIVPIGRWVLNTACEQNAAWQRAGLPPLCMAVNLSPRQFHDPDLLRDVAEALARSGLEARWLELEITEGVVMHDIDRAARLLQGIKALGVRIALDDFGTGYSSLAQLKRFPIDTLKVDRSFIRELSTDAEDQAITEAIIAMGQSLSLTIVAEGVETNEQEAFLREHACDQMQGYYFSKPVAPGEFAALLRKQAAGTVVPFGPAAGAGRS